MIRRAPAGVMPTELAFFLFRNGCVARQQGIDLLRNHRAVGHAGQDGVLQRNRQFPALPGVTVKGCDFGAWFRKTVQPLVHKTYVEIDILCRYARRKQAFNKFGLIPEVPIQQIGTDDGGNGRKIAAFQEKSPHIFSQLVVLR